MDVLAQPLPQPHQLARLELVVEVGQVDVGLAPELPGDQVAQRVRREVTDQAARPVHVLEHSMRVVGNVETRGTP